jgi:hypothetical protein
MAGAADGDLCNTWVWCPEVGGCSGQPYQSCWLKYQPHPEAPAVARGPQVLYPYRPNALAPLPAWWIPQELKSTQTATPRMRGEGQG